MSIYIYYTFSYPSSHFLRTLPKESQMDAAEVDVFLFMMELLSPQSKLDMAGMWKERIPKLKLRIYQLDR